MAYVNLKITGMTCDHCAASVEQALKAQRGVCAAQVGYRQGLAHVEYEPDVVNIAALRQAVVQAGFGAEVVEGVAHG